MLHFHNGFVNGDRDTNLYKEDAHLGPLIDIRSWQVIQVNCTRPKLGISFECNCGIKNPNIIDKLNSLEAL